MVRYKARYLLITIYYPTEPTPSSSNPTLPFTHPSHPSLTKQSLSNLIRDSLALQFGDYGAGAAGNMAVKYFSPATSTGIIKVSRAHYRMLWASLTFIKEVLGRGAVVTVVRVSGTIKKVQIEATRRAKEGIRRAQGVGGEGVGLDVMDVMGDDDDDEGGEGEESEGLVG
ncbi:Rpp14/Pop5 family-domain-containing protein [Tuber borchii]|uniref:Rpp14/Pop5 family-domain-containing protein n=1 Tax=Tuber borchii TaxID=42251 RepID=A0A2T6ZIP1_TUBBO|nr:Rpp14/Pop5 family-domain-containing protein [Tuber borchii]